MLAAASKQPFGALASVIVGMCERDTELRAATTADPHERLRLLNEARARTLSEINQDNRSRGRGRPVEINPVEFEAVTSLFKVCIELAEGVELTRAAARRLVARLYHPDDPAASPPLRDEAQKAQKKLVKQIKNATEKPSLKHAVALEKLRTLGDRQVATIMMGGTAPAAPARVVSLN